jgi:hypothetical protein
LHAVLDIRLLLTDLLGHESQKIDLVSRQQRLRRRLWPVRQMRQEGKRDKQVIKISKAGLGLAASVLGAAAAPTSDAGTTFGSNIAIESCVPASPANACGSLGSKGAHVSVGTLVSVSALDIGSVCSLPGVCVCVGGGR